MNRPSNPLTRVLMGLAAIVAILACALYVELSVDQSGEPITLSELQPAEGSCGDGQCQPPEDCHTCPSDCGSCCGNGRCEPPEDCHSCPRDCGGCS